MDKKFSGIPDLVGIVTSRMCPSCGHHEMGFTTEDGVFYPFEPGALIKVLSKNPQESQKRDQAEKLHQASSVITDRSGKKPWIPDPVRKFRSQALKYGVMIPASLPPEEVDGDIFEKAYLEKLQSLLEKEVDKPLAVILDQHFTAAHLASGNSLKIALNMWKELDEIREPIVKVREWFKKSEKGQAGLLISHDIGEEPLELPIEDSQIERELESLSLEEFLSLL